MANQQKSLKSKQNQRFIRITRENKAKICDEFRENDEKKMEFVGRMECQVAKTKQQKIK